MTDLHRPIETRELLGISESTLRRWSADFKPWLSPRAQDAITESNGVQQRMYTDDDLAFLFRVKHALADGQSSKDIARRLDAGEELPEPPPPRRAASEPLTGAFFGPWRPSDDPDDESGVVADRNNMALLAMAQNSTFQLLEEMRRALADQEAQQQRRHLEAMAKQQELIDTTRAQTAAQLEVATALRRQAEAQTETQARVDEAPTVPIPESEPSLMERLRRWARGSG